MNTVTIHHLPNDVLAIILKYLDNINLKKSGCLSKRFHTLANSDQLSLSMTRVKICYPTYVHLRPKNISHYQYYKQLRSVMGIVLALKKGWNESQEMTSDFLLTHPTRKNQWVNVRDQEERVNIGMLFSCCIMIVQPCECNLTKKNMMNIMAVALSIVFAASFDPKSKIVIETLIQIDKNLAVIKTISLANKLLNSLVSGAQFAKSFWIK